MTTTSRPDYSLWSKAQLIDECATLSYASFCMEPECPVGGPDFDNSFYEPFIDLEHKELVAWATKLLETVSI
jgi:hypothetical protein